MADKTVLGDLGGLLERITECSGRCRDLEQELRNARETRDQLIIEAVDQAGHGQRKVAEAAGVGWSQITRILSRSSAD